MLLGIVLVAISEHVLDRLVAAIWCGIHGGHLYGHFAVCRGELRDASCARCDKTKTFTSRTYASMQKAYADLYG